ncbi:MAG: YmdB family metallophosphoesterase [Clostridia bacterium]|nr:YmdB family metallophosphoesterase [Clostridia bacterium]
MRVLFIGDIVGSAGLSHLKKNLRKLTAEYPCDIVVANGENVNRKNGITKQEAEEIRYAGVDIITLGNHAFRQQSVYDHLDDCNYIVRPANYPSACPGVGTAEFETAKGRIVVVSLAGQVDLDPADNPFYTADRIVKENSDAFIIVDFHAEATSEKRALGYYLDGRVGCVFGTHTHVPTADEQFLPKGTAYMTDVGMTGASDSVLGAEKSQAIQRFLTKAYVPLDQAEGAPKINAVYADTEKKIIERISL